MSGDWLGSLKPDKFQVIFVSDNKDSQGRYWRHNYLLRPDVVSSVPRKKKADEKKRVRLLELLDVERSLTGYTMCMEPIDIKEKEMLISDLSIHYKAGRKFPSYEFTKLKKLTFEAIRKRNWIQFGQIGYEADDIAATIVKVNSQLENPNRLILLTIDSDWMGLIDDYTAWFCMHGWFPRIRSDYFSANTWVEKRLSSSLKSFRGIWDIKGQQGDKSDAIPPSQGALLPIIDLLNPPEEYQLWQQPIGEAIKDTLEYPRYHKVDSKSARSYIEQLGVDLVVRPLDVQTDLAKPKNSSIGTC